MAEDVNEAFESELQKYNLAPGAGELFRMLVMDEYQSSNRQDLDERKLIGQQIEEQEQILSSARKKFLKDMIDEEDFKLTKKECSEALSKLESRLLDLPGRSGELKTIENLLNLLTERYTNILQFYKNQDIEAKRHLISSMYPENLCFDGTQHRTFYLSEPLSLILLINR